MPDPRRHRRDAPAPTDTSVRAAALRTPRGCRGSPGDRTSEPSGGSEHLVDVDPVAAAVRAAQTGVVDRHRQGLREVWRAPHMHSMGGPDELEQALGQFDVRVEVTVLLVAVADRDG